MLISHSRKFIFVHVYKTGGSSISDLLHEECDRTTAEAIGYHATAETIRASIPDSWQKYYTFAFVRNPWDFVVSLYYWLCENRGHDMGPFVRELGSFREFVRYLYEPGGRQVSFQHGSVAEYTRPLKQFVTDDSGCVIVDYLGRFERLEQDWREIGKAIGCSTPLPHVNGSVHPPFRDAFDDETRNMVAELFSDDCHFFGYEF